MQTHVSGQVNNRQHFTLLLILSLALHIFALLMVNNNFRWPGFSAVSRPGDNFQVYLNEKHQPPTSRTVEKNIKQPVSKNIARKQQTEQATNRVTQKQPVTQGTSVAAQQAQLVSIIHKQFVNYFYYPPIALRRHWQGKVTVSFKVLPDGVIKDIKLQQSSGYRVLDLAALKALNKMKSIEAQTQWPDNGIDINLPVEYRINKG